MLKLFNNKNINFTKLYEKADGLYNELAVVKRVKRKRLMFKTIKIVSIIIIIFGIFLLVIFGSNLLAIKNIYSNSVSGKFYLERAVNSAEQQDFDQAIVDSKNSTTKFDQAIKDIEGIKNNILVKNLPIIRSQIDDVDYLLNSAEILSRSVSQAADFGKELRNLLDGNKKFTYKTLLPEEKDRILGKIYRSAPELAGMKANLDLALLSLGNINPIGVLSPFQLKISEVKNKVEAASFVLSKAVPLSQVLPSLAGYPNKSTFLVMLENNDELRPTGGFLGTYGILQMEHGDIQRFETHDIYHMDMPVQDILNIEPPQPIKDYLNKKWYMRDSNWSPDWPTSAQKIEWFYSTENSLLTGKNQINNFNGQFDGVIAVTPKLVKDLLNIIGPIVVDGQEFNANNFSDILQYRVEKGYVNLGIPSWQRKEVIGEIFKELKIRLLNLPTNDWQEMVNVFDNNFLSKDILVYLNDSNLEALIQDQKWTGEISNSGDDYVMVVDSNLAALKTDAVMSKGIEYKISEAVNGLYATLTINYAHQGKPDWKTSEYKSYTRIYVPADSELISSSGFTQPNLDIKKEFNKTVFGGYLTVAPGEVGTIVINYKLPNSIKNLVNQGKYDLYIQKQPGNNTNELKISANFTKKITSYLPVGFSVDYFNGNQISWQTDLEMDRDFSLTF